MPEEVKEEDTRTDGVVVDEVPNTSEEIDEPTEEQIAEWKKLYKHVYAVPVSGKWYYVRPLFRREVKELANAISRETMMATEGEMTASQMTFEDHVALAGLLWPFIGPEETDESLGFLLGTLSDQIMRFSGAGIDAEPIEL